MKKSLFLLLFRFGHFLFRNMLNFAVLSYQLSKFHLLKYFGRFLIFYFQLFLMSLRNLINKNNLIFLCGDVFRAKWKIILGYSSRVIELLLSFDSRIKQGYPSWRIASPLSKNSEKQQIERNSAHSKT
jgi:hypothetical protein